MRYNKDMISSDVIAQTSSILEEIVNAGNNKIPEYAANQLYTPIIMSILGKEYKAIYWCPAAFPFRDNMSNPTFAIHGEWTLVDKDDLASIYERKVYSCFSEFSFLKFDITRINSLSDKIKLFSYDLSFFNYDWSKNGSTYIVSDLSLKHGGILMTPRKNIPEVNRRSESSYSVVFDSEIYFPDYVLLMKE